jgi:hypothetical protein
MNIKLRLGIALQVLLDCVSKKLHPPEFKCRQVQDRRISAVSECTVGVAALQ